MTFSSITFFVFFAIVLAAVALTSLKRFHALPHIRIVRQNMLLAASYVFYGWWDWRFCFLMLGLTFIAWYSAIQLEKH
jgi:alginate O-acetyltransferase complex protein AlgI